MQVAVPVVLDCIVRPPGQEFGYRGPPVAKLQVLVNDDDLLHSQRRGVSISIHNLSGRDRVRLIKTTWISIGMVPHFYGIHKNSVV